MTLLIKVGRMQNLKTYFLILIMLARNNNNDINTDNALAWKLVSKYMIVESGNKRKLISEIVSTM